MRASSSVLCLGLMTVSCIAVASDGTRAIHRAVRVDDVATVSKLVAARADVTTPNEYGVTPMKLAAENGSAAAIRVLLDAGASPNVVDGAGETALMTAVRSGSADAVKLLLDRGASVDARDAEFRQTALMFAVRDGDAEILRLLIDARPT